MEDSTNKPPTSPCLHDSSLKSRTDQEVYMKRLAFTTKSLFLIWKLLSVQNIASYVSILLIQPKNCLLLEEKPLTEKHEVFRSDVFLSRNLLITTKQI